MKVLVPPIKIQGIKTKLVDFIAPHIHLPKGSTWIEPFMGSWVVWFNLAPDKAIFSDTNPHTISLYWSLNKGKFNHLDVKRFLEQEGKKLLEKWEDYYKFVRNRFNKEKNPLDFLFLNRSCFNGMIRFNRKWEFNVPFCKKPERFAPAYITKITHQVKNLQTLMKKNHWSFVCQDFREVISNASSSDFIYCDPPYIWRNVDYYDSRNEKDEIDLCNILKQKGISFIMSTRHSNTFRSNSYLESLRKEYPIVTTQHLYHLWGKEKNRNTIVEALILNISQQEFFITSEASRRKTYRSLSPLFTV